MTTLFIIMYLYMVLNSITSVLLTKRILDEPTTALSVFISIIGAFLWPISIVIGNWALYITKKNHD